MKKINIMKRYYLLIGILLCCFTIILIFDDPLISKEDVKATYKLNHIEPMLKSPQYSIKYTSYSPIIINGNNELGNSEFNGSGTVIDPYRIENLEIISNGSTASIIITNTSANMHINHCALKNGTSGIYLFNVSNVEILNNTLIENNNGISLSNTNNITITNNTLLNNTIGVNLLEKNHESLIFRNTIVNNSMNGVSSLFSSSLIISNNSISNNTDFGVYISSSNNCTIYSNDFSLNRLEAVYLNTTTNKVLVIHNNFFQNNLNSDSQAFDNGVGDIFRNNHWDDWIEPDTNFDGIVDNIYLINGNANTSDLFPQVNPNEILSSEDNIDSNPSSLPTSSFILASIAFIASYGLVSSGVLYSGRILIEKKSIVLPKKDSSYNESIPKITFSDKESTLISWIAILIAPMFPLVSQILYPPIVRKLSRVQVLNNPIRQKILRILKDREFEHFNSLKTQLQCGTSVFEWHLQVLEDFEFIRTSLMGQYKIISLKSTKLDKYKVKLYFSIKSDKAISIVNLLLNQPFEFHPIKQIAQSLNISLTTIIYHCNKLVDLGLFTKQPKVTSYMIAENKREYLEWLIDRHTKGAN